VKYQQNTVYVALNTATETCIKRQRTSCSECVNDCANELSELLYGSVSVGLTENQTVFIVYNNYTTTIAEHLTSIICNYDLSIHFD